MSEEEQSTAPAAYPPLLGDLALCLELGTLLTALEDAVVLLGIHVQRLVIHQVLLRDRGPGLGGRGCHCASHLLPATTHTALRHHLHNTWTASKIAIDKHSKHYRVM
jgi:hypothetical protein